MKKLMIVFASSAIFTGCVWTSQTSEVTVQKDPNGNVVAINYIERLEQRDVKPWQPFGGYLKEYGPKECDVKEPKKTGRSGM